MRNRVGPLLMTGIACLAVVCGAARIAAQATEPAKTGAASPATQGSATAPQHILLGADDLKWGPAPPGLPPGAQLAVVDGDPGKAMRFVVAVKFPDGYTVPPHWHPTDEHLDIISGSLTVGMGKTMDESSGKALGAGGYAQLPRRMPHWAKAKGETMLHLSSMGPFKITYVNPKDDPRKAGTQ
jgi:quercetin dioxygenase-like cupin family protein